VISSFAAALRLVSGLSVGKNISETGCQSSYLEAESAENRIESAHDIKAQSFLTRVV
jgi:hypothetical protein